MDEDKDFFDSMNTKLSDFYNLEIVETESSSKDLYPIQEELKTLRIKFEGSRKVGAGAMKEVFEVKDLPSGRKVAKAKLKDCSDPKAVESFLREARLTASLQHPNIIRIYEIGFDQYPWFSMEFIEGQSLEEKIQHHKQSGEEWPLFQRLEIFNKVCDALAYAHSKKIIHLDIKPDNIVLGLYGEVIVCDWGLGHILYNSSEASESHIKIDLSNEHTMHGYIRGTPGFMAPERINNVKSIDADIFSLGALLFQLINYKAPFEGKDHTEVLRKTLSSELSPQVDNIPVGIKSVYLKALEADPEDRYSSVKELQADVEKFRNDFATDAENAGFLKQFILLCKRNKIACSLAASFILLISIILTSYINDIKQKNERIFSEKEKAEQALKMFKEEQQKKQDIAKNFTSLLVESSKNNTHGFDVEQSLKKLEYALKQDPENSEAWLVKGYTHFICHQFSDAYFSFKKSGLERIEKPMQISLKYKDHKGLLSPKEHVEVLKEFGDTSDLALTFIFLYDGETRTEAKDHSYIVKYLLEYRNKAANFRFKFNQFTQSLNLSDNIGLFHLDSDFGADLKISCLLKFLNLKTLDLTNTNFSNLNQIKELDLEELNLANTPVMDLRPLLNMESLKRVILDKAQSKIAEGNWTFEISYTQDQGRKNSIEQEIKKLLGNFQYVDTNKDNYISLEELLEKITTVHEQDLNIFFILCDTDKDNKLSLKEINNLSIKNSKTYFFIEKAKMSIKDNFLKIDLDGDGALSMKEINKLTRGKLPLSIFKKIDSNKDDLITENEIKLFDYSSSSRK